MVHDAPGGHIGVQAVLKPEVHVASHGPIAAGNTLM